LTSRRACTQLFTIKTRRSRTFRIWISDISVPPKQMVHLGQRFLLNLHIKMANGSWLT